jgi:tetratricopeptide (TPR) repeat protein
VVAPSAYTIEILLEPRAGGRRGVFDLTLIDRVRQNVFEASVVDLDLAGKTTELPSGRALLADDFCLRLRRGEPVPEEQGLAFGHLLLSLLLTDGRVARAWNDIHARRSVAGRAMRLVLDVRSGPAGADDPRPGVSPSSIPFELMADDHGFLFHERGHVLVRVAEPGAPELERVEEAPPETRRAGDAGSLLASTKPRGIILRGPLAWAVPQHVARPASFEGSVTIEETARAWSKAVSTVPAGPDAAPLPQPSPHFIGRDDEVMVCLERLASERLVTVVGLPGIGKTDLASVVAHMAVHDGAGGFAKGLWFAVEGLTEVDGLRARMALGLGLDPKRCRSDEDLARGIGSGRVLIVFDGAEVLLRDPLTKTRFQWFLNTLLQECAGLHFLISTSKRLGDVVVPSGDVAIAKESAVELGPLKAPAAKDVFIATAGVRLSSMERRSPDLTALVASLMGHPRAILIAASEAGAALNLRELRERIEQGASSVRVPIGLFGVDEGTEDDLRVRRYLSAQGVAASSLKAQNRRALEVLVWLGYLPAGLPEALFPHVFGEGAEAVGAALVRRHLIERRELDRHIRLSAPLECFPIRPSEFLPDDRQVALLERTFAGLGAWLTAPFDPPGTWRDRDRAVHEESNLAALVLAIPEPAPEEGSEALAKAAASAIVPFAQLMMRVNRPRAASEVCREAVRHIAALGITGTPLAAVLTALGDLFVRIERFADAEQAYANARPVYQAMGDHYSEATTLNALGDVFARTGRAQDAEAAYVEALPIFQALGERLGEANALRALGDLRAREDRLKEAEEVYVQARSVYQSLGERVGEASARQALGDLMLRTDRLKEAEWELAGALRLYREIDEGLGEANTLQALGDLFLRTDRLKEAEDAYSRALPIYREIEQVLGEASTLRSLGEVYLRTDRLSQADTSFRHALYAYRALDDKLGKANTLQSLGKLALMKQDGEAAFGLFLSALRLHEAAGNRLGVGGDRGYLARAARIAGRPLRAAVLGGQALAALDRDDDRFGQMVAMRDLARSLAALGEQKGAVAAWYLAWARGRMIADPSAPSIAAMLAEVLQDFNPSAPPEDEAVARYESDLAEVLAGCEAKLKLAGEDPYTYLDSA